jgi:predicted kinase
MSKVLIVAGPPASGKTVFATALSKKLGFVVFDLDDRLAEFIENDRSQMEKVGIEQFLAEIRDRRYQDLIERGVRALNAGQSVILTAPFSREIQDHRSWTALISPFLEVEIEPQLIWIRTDHSKVHERMLARGEMRDSEKTSSEDAFNKYLQSINHDSPVVAYIEVNGALPIDSQLQIPIR